MFTGLFTVPDEHDGVGAGHAKNLIRLVVRSLPRELSHQYRGSMHL